MVRRRLKLDLEAIEAMLAEGTSLAKIAVKLKCHPASVSNFLYEIDPKYRHIVRQNAKKKRVETNFTNPTNNRRGYKAPRQYEDGT
jgi:hypothetical protein